MSQGSLVPGFLLAIVAGGLLGAVYDSFRVLRILLGGGRRWQVLFDMMTMAAAALCSAQNPMEQGTSMFTPR